MRTVNVLGRSFFFAALIAQTAMFAQFPSIYWDNSLYNLLVLLIVPTVIVWFVIIKKNDKEMEMLWMVWGCYVATLLIPMICLIFGGLKGKLDSNEFFGPNVLIMTTCGSPAIAFLLLASAEDTSKRNIELFSQLCGSIVLDLFDDIEILEILISQNENFYIPAKNQTFLVLARNESFYIPARNESSYRPARNESFYIPARNESFYIPARNESFYIPARNEFFYIPARNESSYIMAARYQSSHFSAELEISIIFFVCISLLLSTLEMAEWKSDGGGRSTIRRGTSFGRHVLFVLLVNIPLLVIRLVVWLKYKHSASIFIAKNLIIIVISIINLLKLCMEND